MDIMNRRGIRYKNNISGTLHFVILSQSLSMSILPGAFIIIFIFLMLPFFLANELGYK